VKKLLFPIFLCFSFGWAVLTTSSLSQAQTVSSVNTPLDFGSVNVCASSTSFPAGGCSAPGTAQFNVTAGGNLGVPRVLTLGVPNQDFQLATTTCNGTVTTGSSCTVNVIFAPKFSGVRSGAVEITDQSGNVLAIRLVQGTGLGPQLDVNTVQGVGLGPLLNLNAGSLTALASSPDYQAHYGVAVDAAGNIFYGNNAPAAVYKIPAAGGSPVVVTTLTSSPLDLALDGAGNLYVTTGSGNKVVEVPPGCGDPSCQILIDGGFYFPTGIAVDMAGNVYVADTGNRRVVEMPYGCVTGFCPVLVGSGWSYPSELALDYAGNLFVGDADGGVQKLNISSGAMTTIVPYRTMQVGGMVVDPAGDLYFTYLGNEQVVSNTGKQILEAPAGGGPLVTVETFASQPLSLALDGGGDIFITNTLSNAAVFELPRVQVPTYTFATTPLGESSTDSPQIYLLQNTGNADLSVLNLTPDSLNNFIQVAGPGTPPDCKTGLFLAPGSMCDLSLSYAPKSDGLVNFNVAVLNNTGYTTATQTIPVAGIGGEPGAPVSFPAGFSYVANAGPEVNNEIPVRFYGAVFANNALQLTDGGQYEARGAFFDGPSGLQCFQTSFDFQLTGKDSPTPDADGFAFVLQSSFPGFLNLGTAGGGLGYGLPSLTEGGTQMLGSAAIKFDLYNNDGEGTSSTGLYLNGAAPTVPAINLLPSGIDLHSGHVFHVVLLYDGLVLKLSITDQITKATFSTSFQVDLTSLLPFPLVNVGFTGGTGGETAVQSILNWQMTSSIMKSPLDK
jgi:Legume lectin domain/NHL repeat